MGLGHAGITIPNIVNWTELKALAEQHGLLGVVVDGIEEIRRKRLGGRCNLPDKLFLTQWIGEVIHEYEYRYEAYGHAIGEMAAFYNSHGYKMMVLKGYACSMDWPKPEHRPCGDIDIWLFGRQKDADAALVKEKGIRIDKSHHHHTVFGWGDFMVENHYDFINVHHHKSNAEIEKILKDLGSDDTHFVELNGEKVYLPSPNLHALFLLKHLMMHFAAEGIMLRQLVDWGFFVKAHTNEIDWPWLLDVLERFGMRNMYNILNAICVEDLGFEAGIFYSVQFNPYLKEKVLKEIVEPEFGVMMPQGLVSRVIFKLRRWQGNAWKHQLCYKESMGGAFWSELWSHLLKPSSI